VACGLYLQLQLHLALDCPESCARSTSDDLFSDHRTVHQYDLVTIELCASDGLVSIDLCASDDLVTIELTAGPTRGCFKGGYSAEM
jgi:hypothetical protein